MTDIHTCSYQCDRPACIREQRDELASRLAAAAVPEYPEHVRRLVGKLDMWRMCMSHSDSYVGEPAGTFKSAIHELARAVDPIYPESKDANPFPDLVIYTAKHPNGIAARDLVAAANEPSIVRTWQAMADRIAAGESEASVLDDYGLLRVSQHERIVVGLEERNEAMLDAGKYVVMAFEKMGRTDGVVATMQARTNCEDALVKLKAAIDAFLTQADG